MAGNIFKQVYDALLAPLPPPVKRRPNVERIEAIPYDVLPYASPARDTLMALALRFPFVDAEHNGDGSWTILIEPGDASLPGGRYTVEEWTAVEEQVSADLLPPGSPLWDRWY